MRSGLVVLLVTLVVGCGSGVGGRGGLGSRAEPEAGTPVSSTIPEGIYFGRATYRYIGRVSGELLDDSTETSQATEIVDANGLPLIQPDGVTPAAGVVLTRELGGLVFTFEVLDVQASGNRVVINYFASIRIEDSAVEGTGTLTYEFLPPDTLEYRDSFSGRSNPSIYGDVLSVSFTGSARLSLGESESDDPEGPPPSTDPTNPPVEPVDNVLAVDDVLPATWLVLFGDDSSLGSATAFAIDHHRLATNAHVVEGIADALCSPTGGAVVVQHETGAFIAVTAAWSHADYDGNSVASPDVGVIEVDGTLPSSLRLAGDDVVQGLRVLQTVTLCGFPGDVSLAIDFPALQTGEDFRPRASCFTGSINALRPFDAATPATPANSQLIQHDIPATRGTSGSPILDGAGYVVGVMAAGTTDAEGSNHFAPRVDTLVDLLDMIDDGVLAPVDFSDCLPPTAFDGMRPGQWEGLTGQGRTISFRVSGNNVTDIAFGYLVDSPYCYRDVALERCPACSALSLHCSFAAGWPTDPTGTSDFFVFADGCSDADNQTVFGRVSAFPPDCLGFVSDIPWTATWVGP